MTGPEHYREAEHLIEDGIYDDDEPERVLRDIAEAQVHATLALAAATALGHYTPEDDFPQADRAAWYVAASEGPSEKRRQREAEAAEAAEFAEPQS